MSFNTIREIKIPTKSFEFPLHILFLFTPRYYCYKPPDEEYTELLKVRILVSMTTVKPASKFE